MRATFYSAAAFNQPENIGAWNMARCLDFADLVRPAAARRRHGHDDDAFICPTTSMHRQTLGYPQAVCREAAVAWYHIMSPRDLPASPSARACVLMRSSSASSSRCAMVTP